ncbi:hypothetical protein Y1Q_0012390 [Alligator mississippiensis]|uniref:Uncharacterized protein n=1 Tax=Alligator mississippiensis TaxID=8496 RepID=A0A151MJT6_ALLMI|nr:hypothetical protein Y1Q_0012390 [Alligator mississippiensis]
MLKSRLPSCDHCVKSKVGFSSLRVIYTLCSPAVSLLHITKLLRQYKDAKSLDTVLQDFLSSNDEQCPGALRQGDLCQLDTSVP